MAGRRRIAHPPAVAHTMTPLLDDDTVLRIANDFFELNVTDPLTQEYYEGVDAMRLRRMFRQFVVSALGGVGYDREAMRRAHRWRNITHELFDIVIGHLREAMMMHAPEMTEIVLRVAESTREDMVSLTKPSNIENNDDDDDTLLFKPPPPLAANMSPDGVRDYPNQEVVAAAAASGCPFLHRRLMLEQQQRQQQQRGEPAQPTTTIDRSVPRRKVSLPGYTHSSYKEGHDPSQGRCSFASKMFSMSGPEEQDRNWLQNDDQSVTSHESLTTAVSSPSRSPTATPSLRTRASTSCLSVSAESVVSDSATIRSNGSGFRSRASSSLLAGFAKLRHVVGIRTPSPAPVRPSIRKLDEEQMEMMSRRFFERNIEDPRIRIYYQNINEERLLRMMTCFLNHVVQGTPYNRNRMRAAHRRLAVFDASHFDAVINNLSLVLKQDFPGVLNIDEIDRIMKEAEGMRADIVQNPNGRGR